jgi:hypothetical protein
MERPHCSFRPDPLTNMAAIDWLILKILLKSANQKQESPVAAMSVNGSGRNEQSL